MAEKLKERKEKREREREGEKQGTNEWMKIELDKKSASKHAYCFYEAVFGCRKSSINLPSPHSHFREGFNRDGELI